MKFFKRFLIGVVIFIILALAAVFLYVQWYGAALLQETLSRSLQRKVELKSLSYRFPFGVQASRVRVEGGISADEVQAQFKPSSLWAQKIDIQQWTVKNGRFQYAQEFNGSDFSFQLEEIYLEAGNLVLPLEPMKTPFHFWGRLVKEGNPLSGSKVDGSGWADFVTKDMEGRLQIVGVDGRAALTAGVSAQNNDMTVQGDLKVSGLPLGAGKDFVAGTSAVGNLISGVLSSMGVEIGAKFSFKTKMDDFQVSNISFSGQVAAEDFSSVLAPGKTVPPFP